MEKEDKEELERLVQEVMLAYNLKEILFELRGSLRGKRTITSQEIKNSYTGDEKRVAIEVLKKYDDMSRKWEILTIAAFRKVEKLSEQTESVSEQLVRAQTTLGLDFAPPPKGSRKPTMNPREGKPNPLGFGTL
jgi:hypothetical protein